MEQGGLASAIICGALGGVVAGCCAKGGVALRTEKRLWRDGAGMYGNRRVGNVPSSLLKISTRRLFNATSLDLHLCFIYKAI